jgi:hypothetical protein
MSMVDASSEQEKTMTKEMELGGNFTFPKTSMT